MCWEIVVAYLILLVSIVYIVFHTHIATYRKID
jgi:hypothetical protein